MNCRPIRFSPFRGTSARETSPDGILHDYEVWWDDHPDAAARGRRWAAENPKRFLAAQIAVGTVDQAMMGALQVRNAHMRAACLARNLLVMDEVHASDTYMSHIIKSLLDAHLGAGGYALLMSATLGSVARNQWLFTGRSGDTNTMPLEEAIDSPYPAISVMTPEGGSLTKVEENDRQKSVQVVAEPQMRDFRAVAQRALRAARARAKVLVVRNTVGHAIGTQQALEALADNRDAGLLFDVEGRTTLHHGRFAACDREMLDKRIEEMLGKGRQSGGRVVVGTQTLEQSLDIDADLLITDLCPVDVLLQRIGRSPPPPARRPSRRLRDAHMCRADPGRAVICRPCSRVARTPTASVHRGTCTAVSLLSKRRDGLSANIPNGASQR